MYFIQSSQGLQEVCIVEYVYQHRYRVPLADAICDLDVLRYEIVELQPIFLSPQQPLHEVDIDRWYSLSSEVV